VDPIGDKYENVTGCGHPRGMTAVDRAERMAMYEVAGFLSDRK
jgi:hypothetical protein